MNIGTIRFECAYEKSYKTTVELSAESPIMEVVDAFSAFLIAVGYAPNLVKGVFGAS